MVEPLSLAAVTAFLGAVAAGSANEVGRRVAESVGGMVARVVGRSAPAPTGAAERAALARELLERAGEDPARAGALARWVNGLPGGATPADGLPPNLLPAPFRFFTDRRGPLAELDREAGRKPDGRPKVAVLHGPEGIGTSSLAHYWGSREQQRFPDGTLYADLRGNGSDTGALLRRFLLRLHVPADRVPPAVDDRVGLLRTLLADRRLLVVLDHVGSAVQVRPLITSAPGVFTLVVASRPVAGLDAVPVAVGPLADKDARRLLTDLAGKDVMAAARSALPEILRRCGGSPFALRAAALDLAAAEVEAGGRPDGTGVARADDDPVRAAVARQYAGLGPAAARFHRLNALHPWPALTPGPAAAAAGVPVDDAALLLAELADRQLLESAPDGRYRHRPAVRSHAVEEAARTDGPAACAAALTRTVEWYLTFAVAADYAALKERWHVSPLFDRIGPGPYPDEGAAVAALQAEAANLVEASLTAEQLDRPDLLCPLVEALWALQLKSGSHELLLPALRAGARAAADRFPGTLTAGRMHTQLAWCLLELGAYEEAEHELRSASAAEEAAGHLRGRATAVESLGLLRLRQWRFPEALECFEHAERILDGIEPDGEGAADLPRARALLVRHRGRALRGLGRFAESRRLLTEALGRFEASGEPYNTARVLTDLAETHLDEGAGQAAAPLIERAAAVLRRQNATAQLELVDLLRLRLRWEAV
ncbi:tetratricopeptide repeat protein [Kitasatospora sp. NPDC054939]